MSSPKKDLADLMQKQIGLTKEMLKWLRFMGSSQVTASLNTTLSNDKLRLAYQLSDGKNTSTLISQLTGISQPRISELWKQWVLAGLGDTMTASGGTRFRRAFDLKAIGIPVPEIRLPESDAGTQQQNAGDAQK
ncbi:MAG: hypothetical protein ACRD5H_15945 [Nitrososphaerales archaeon]